VGLGHVEDARVLAQQAGRNPDRWEDVREFLPLLSQERWYTRTKRGYARGWEPVRYVDNVQSYLNILQVAGTSMTADGPPPDPELDSNGTRKL
jgi:membrane-bound lytic murein transglycosylase F